MKRLLYLPINILSIRSEATKPDTINALPGNKVAQDEIT